jgi:hypothetical protein
MKTKIILLCALSLPGMLFAQFESFRVPYQNPNHTGILLDSLVLPVGNFKTMTYQYEVSSGTWRLAEQNITEREGSKIIKTFRTIYPTNNNTITYITTYDYADKLRTISNYAKLANSNDTSLTGRDTFHYNNDVVVMRHSSMISPPRTTTEYIYDSLNRFTGSRLNIYDTTIRNITYMSYFEVDEFHQNLPKRISKFSYSIYDTFFVHKNDVGYEFYRYDSLNRLTSKLNYLFSKPLSNYILMDTIKVIYNSYNNPTELLRWTNAINVQNRITTYTYNDEQILTEVFEREENGQPRTRIIYTTDISTGKNEIELNSVAVNIYPNPATSMFEIHTTDDVRIAHVTLFTISGSRAMEISKPAKQIEINQLPAGLYFVEMETNKGKVHKRLVVN